MTDGRQLSLFGVEAAPPVPLDLDGLLAGSGQVTRMGGTARVSIVVDERWRAAVLLSEFAARGLTAACEPSTVEGHLCVRTAYSSALAALGARWLRGAAKTVPKGFAFDGRRLRLLLAAAGAPDGLRAYTIRLGPDDGEEVWRSIGAALAAVGLPSLLIEPRAGGPAYRVVGRRRLARLVELVGEPPPYARAESWPR